MADALPSSPPTIAARWSVVDTMCRRTPFPDVCGSEITERTTLLYVQKVNSLSLKNTQFSKRLLVKGDNGKPCCLWCGHFPAWCRLGNVLIPDDRWMREMSARNLQPGSVSVLPPPRSALIPDPPREVWHVSDGRRAKGCIHAGAGLKWWCCQGLWISCWQDGSPCLIAS